MLNYSAVSAEHASLYFDGAVWKVRDLGSRNGTFVNGQAVDVRRAHELKAGDRLAFGKAEQSPWMLDSIDPPGPAARTPGGVALRGSGAALWLPRDEDPEACIRFQDGRWIASDAEASNVVRDGDTFVVAGEPYVLELPPWHETAPELTESTLDLGASTEVTLRFVASLDEEHVSMEASLADRVVSLGARAHNFALLCLARRRLAERAAGTTETECGWCYTQDLRESLGMDRVTLNLQLWRATQAMKRLGLPAERLVERRADAQQLRIGFWSLDITEAHQ